MRKGFTILELLVASLLLGMLMTILTMIFNQSSIAWRTGKAVTDDMSVVRENIAEVREEADNAFVHAGQLYRITGLWDSKGDLRDRACDAPGSVEAAANEATYLRNKISGLSNLKPSNMKSFSVGSSEGSDAKRQNFTVNVKSAGPNGTFNDYDDIWSWPDQWD